MIWWGSLSLPLHPWIYGPCEPTGFCFILFHSGSCSCVPDWANRSPSAGSCVLATHPLPLSFSLLPFLFFFFLSLPFFPIPPFLISFSFSLSLTLSFFRTFSFSGRQDAHPVICLTQPRTWPLLPGPWFPSMGNSVLSWHTVLGVTVMYLPLGLSRLMWWTRAACGNSNLTSHKIKKIGSLVHQSHFKLSSRMWLVATTHRNRPFLPLQEVLLNGTV